MDCGGGIFGERATGVYNGGIGGIHGVGPGGEVCTATGTAVVMAARYRLGGVRVRTFSSKRCRCQEWQCCASARTAACVHFVAVDGIGRQGKSLAN